MLVTFTVIRLVTFTVILRLVFNFYTSIFYYIVGKDLGREVGEWGCGVGRGNVGNRFLKFTSRDRFPSTFVATSTVLFGASGGGAPRAKDVSV